MEMSAVDRGIGEFQTNYGTRSMASPSSGGHIGASTSTTAQDVDLKKEKQELKQAMVNMIVDSMSVTELLKRYHARYPLPGQRRTRKWVYTIKNKLKEGVDPTVITRDFESLKRRRTEIFGEIKEHLRIDPSLTLEALAEKTGSSTSSIHRILQEYGYKKSSSLSKRKPVLSPKNKEQRRANAEK